MPDIRQIAREVGDDHTLALALSKTGIADAQIVASIIADPDRITQRQAEQWVKTFKSWDVCDQVCQNLFDKTPWAWKVVRVWDKRDEEFIKCAAFSLLACLIWHDTRATDGRFVACSQSSKMRHAMSETSSRKRSIGPYETLVNETEGYTTTRSN